MSTEPPDNMAPGPAVAMQPPPPHTQPPAVRVRGLLKTYGRVVAVDRLNLDVPTGSVVGLIGPNGAGKTTTMLAIATLLTPDEGVVEVFGHNPLTDPRSVRAAVGWMPDFFGLYEGLTCIEYLDFFAAAYRVPAAVRRSRTHDLLDLVDLGDKRTSDVAGLSRGMQQRLGLARTLVHDPRLLVLDEPASGLDPRARVELREILLELARQGKTILISSHILAELGELCDRVAIVQSGRVLAQGTPDEIKTASRSGHAVVARILGGPDEVQRAVRIALASGALQAVGQGPSLLAELQGGEEVAADLLSALVAANLRVVSFAERDGGLERLFLSVTNPGGNR
jgi:ABC-2 type transport system ATP-binding protein